MTHGSPAGLDHHEIVSIERLHPHLAYRQQELQIDHIQARDLVQDGRPTIVYLPQRAVDNYRSLVDAFSRHFDVSVRAALKSCYVPPVLRALQRAGAGADVASMVEWSLARACGFPPESIVANSPGRTADETRRLVSTRTGLLGVDGDEALDLVEWAARSTGLRPRILLRVNPPGSSPYFAAGNKLGISGARAAALVERAARSAVVDLVGVHSHGLRQCTDPQLYHDYTRALVDFVTGLDAVTRSRIRVLDLGGGLQSRFLLERSGSSAEQLAAAAAEAISPLRPTPKLILEPGRYLTADSAVALTSVVATKQTDGRRWVLTEIGSNVLTPFPDRAYHPLPTHLSEPRDWAVVGVTDSGPVPNHFCLDATLPPLRNGDWLALLNCGAYTTVYTELWIHETPDIVVIDGGCPRKIFGRDDYLTLFRTMYSVDISGFLVEEAR